MIVRLIKWSFIKLLDIVDPEVDEPPYISRTGTR